VDDGPLMIVLDESAAISDSIIGAAEERCNPTRFLMMGSPLDPTGLFYQATASLAPYYKQHKLTQPECTKALGYWLDASDHERRIAKYGAEHPLVQSSVFADFSLKVEGALLSLREFEAAIESPPAAATGRRHVFLDFAAGRAENVLAAAVGNTVKVDAWRERNTMAAIGEFVVRLNRLKREIGLRPDEVEGDADGLGIVFCDALAEAGWPIGEFHGGSAPRFTTGDYGNLVAEVWTEGTNAIRRREWILPNDEALKAQLISRKTKRNSKGLLMLESKEEMAARGLESPDRADAVLGAIAPCPLARSTNIMGQDAELAAQFAEAMEAGGGDGAPITHPTGGWAG
jgi:hypothetical protein